MVRPLGVLLIAVVALILGFAVSYYYFDNKETCDLLSEDCSNLDDFSDWTSYTNAEYGYSLKYPSDWIVYENSNRVSVEQKTRSRDISLDDETISIYVMNLKDEGLTADQYIEDGVKAGRLSGLEDCELNSYRAKCAISHPVNEKNVTMIESNNHLYEISTNIIDWDGEFRDEDVLNNKESAKILSTFVFSK